MESSEEINEIAAAMAKAQAMIQNPKKENENPHFKSKYADLASGLNAIRPALSANGIALFQATGLYEGTSVILRTRLVHSSGQWIGSTYPVSALAQHQAMASALTYAKRQSLFALVGVAGEDDDDDGDAAVKHQDTKPVAATGNQKFAADAAAQAGTGALRMFYTQNPQLKELIDWKALADMATEVDARRLNKEAKKEMAGGGNAEGKET